MDGLVFVADSAYEKMEENVESFKNMEDNLKTLKLNLADIPYVLQYNKRDAANPAPTEYMDFLLNNRDVQLPSRRAQVRGGLRDAQRHHRPAAQQVPQRRKMMQRSAISASRSAVSRSGFSSLFRVPRSAMR